MADPKVQRMIYNLRQLRMFMAVVETGSANRAAQAVNTTQPTLSRLISEMEAKLGQRLFERNAKGMVPTEAGQLLIPHARLILYEVESANEAMRALGGLQRGTVRIGAVATVARSILPEAIAALLAQSPGLRVSLIEGPDDQLVAALLQLKVDVIITAALPFTEGVSVVRDCHYDDTYAAFCGADNPLALRHDVTLEEIMRHAWIMPAAGATPRQLFDRLLSTMNVGKPAVAVETTSVDAMISCVSKTHLLGWLPYPLLRTAIAGGLIRPLKVPELELHRQFFIYRRDRGLLPAPARELLKFIASSPKGEGSPIDTILSARFMDGAS